MKAKRILSLLAGLFNVLLGGLGAILGMLMFLLGSLIRQMFESSYELVEEVIESLASADPSYEYLRDLDKAESVDFIMKYVKIFAVIFLLLGLLYVLFGILNLVISKGYSVGRDLSKGKKIAFVVCSWLLLWFNVANILTTIAIFLKTKKSANEYKLYSSKDTQSV